MNFDHIKNLNTVKKSNNLKKIKTKDKIITIINFNTLNKHDFKVRYYPDCPISFIINCNSLRIKKKKYKYEYKYEYLYKRNDENDEGNYENDENNERDEGDDEIPPYDNQINYISKIQGMKNT